MSVLGKFQKRKFWKSCTYIRYQVVVFSAKYDEEMHLIFDKLAVECKQNLSVIKVLQFQCILNVIPVVVEIISTLLH